MPRSIGQIQSGETIMVVIIVTVLLFLGFFAYANYKTNTYEQRAEQLQSLRVVDTAQQAASMRTTACAYTTGTTTDCLDLYRVDYLNDSQPSEYRRKLYHEQFGNALITVHQIYPTKERWTLYNESTNTSRSAVQIPIHIRNPITKNSRFGYLNVVKYE